MAQAKDLMSGAGFSAPAANMLGFNAGAVTAAGTTSGAATAIPPTVTWANVTTASSNTGVKLPVATALNPLPLYTPVVVSCTGGQTGVVYPPSGATVNGTTSVDVSDNTMKTFYQVSATAWVGT